ncbi:MAG: hypothetical protein JXK94_08565 [Deltaproteobacteria bacterium]|nr:hypothetical protein [Deltaproteobacteria bacterium]
MKLRCFIFTAAIIVLGAATALAENIPDSYEIFSGTVNLDSDGYNLTGTYIYWASPGVFAALHQKKKAAGRIKTGT